MYQAVTGSRAQIEVACACRAESVEIGLRMGRRRRHGHRRGAGIDNRGRTAKHIHALLRVQPRATVAVQRPDVRLQRGVAERDARSDGDLNLYKVSQRHRPGICASRLGNRRNPIGARVVAGCLKGLGAFTGAQRRAIVIAVHLICSIDR